MWLLAVLFPLLIGSGIPSNDKNWVCYGLLLKILNICMSRMIDVSTVIKLKELIKDHHSKFLGLYPGKMTPKFSGSYT